MKEKKTSAAARKTNGAGFIFDLLSLAENAKQIFHDVYVPCIFIRTSNEKILAILKVSLTSD